MKRVLLDTNIYGKMIETGNFELIGKLGKHSFLSVGIVIYGSDLIRKELRATSRSVIHSGKKLRPLLLSLYDGLALGHSLPITPKMREIAEHYHLTYRELGGSLGSKELFNDFLIVALASLNGLDVVYSEDSRTLASVSATKAYKIVNGIYGIRTPHLEPYSEFIREIRRLLP